jgi:hypothetical protein
MTFDEFMSELKCILNIHDDVLKMETELGSLDEWDSLAMFSVFILFKKIGVSISFPKIDALETVGDLVDLVKDKLSE